MEDRVDILLATYNGERYIQEQLHSILQQTHQNFHVLIRDDLSTDNTLSVIQKFVTAYPEKMTLFSSQERLGVKGNFSFLMQKATSPYMMFSDQDDIWILSKIEDTLKTMKDLEKLKGTTTPLLVHSDLQVLGSNQNILCSSFWDYANLKTEKMRTLNRLLTQNVVTGCSMMINRTLGALAYPIPDKTCMHDWWIALVAAALGHIEILKKATILYRQHQNNVLGAKKFGSWNHFKEKIFNLAQDDEIKLAQAKTLLLRYQNQLKPEQKHLIEVYTNLKNQSWLRNKYNLLKYKFFKSGLRRGLVAFFLKKQP